MKPISNLKTSFIESPLNKIKINLLILISYSIIALSIGTLGNLFNYQLLQGKLAYILPFTLFIFPVLFEEVFFRGVLIPREIFYKNRTVVFKYIFFSSLLFTLWHPFNAFLFNPTAQIFFYDFYFLVIVFVLGIACGLGYVISKSIWVPLFIHWLTVVVWVLFLGGRNLLKENVL